jgi:hypothetical protein
VIANATVQRQLELRNLAAQLTQGETGQSLWTVLAADDRVQHRLPTFAHGVGHGAGKLDVGALQQLLDAAADPGLLLRERGSGSLRAQTVFGAMSQSDVLCDWPNTNLPNTNLLALRQIRRASACDADARPEASSTTTMRSSLAARYRVYFGACPGGFSLVGGTIPLSRK